MRIRDSYHDAQQQNNTLANGLEVSAEAREGLIPGGFGTRISRLSRSQTGHSTKGHKHGVAMPFRSGRTTPATMYLEDGAQVMEEQEQARMKGDVAVVLPPAPVLVVGSGPVQVLAARLAAIRGYQTTLACIPQLIDESKTYIWNDKYPEGSIPLNIIPIDDTQAMADAISAAQGLIVALDRQTDFLPEPVLNAVLSKEFSNVKRVALMSRYLNGEGMGFIPKSAKAAANAEIWAGDEKLIPQYKSMEKEVCDRAKEVGASATIIRAGTLKGGAVGDSLKGGNGEPTFLDPTFYQRGVQDVANWRLLFDCGSLGVKLTKGDTLPGPGFTAVFTALDLGAGDSHRGAVAAALVEALRSVSAADADFSVGAEKGNKFPSEAEWPALFDNAA